MLLTYKLLTIIGILNYVIRAEVYFYEDELLIHSKKDINNFYINLEAINELAKHIDGSISYFKKRETQSKGKNLAITTFNLWLQADAQLCSKEIKQKRRKALDLSRDSLPDEIHKHVDEGKIRTKRGFKPLGSLVAFLTDLPSPQSWEKYSTLVDNLREVVLGNTNQTQTISRTISDITDTTKKLSEDYEEITKKTWKLEGELDSFKFYLQAKHKLNIVCKEGNLIADNVIEEAEKIDEIRKKARLNLPSELLFPLGEIYERTINLSHSHAFPLFRNEDEIEQIYAMSSSITTIDKNVIHAIVSIPLVNFNNRFEFIDIDITEEEIEIIHNLSKLSRQPIDHILCGRLDQVKVLSTSKLNRCLRTQNAKIFFCNERRITNFKHATNKCSKLPETIIVELSSHKVLLKTPRKNMNMNIICNGVNDQVTLNKTYNIIKINPNCKASTEDFRIEKIGNSMQMKMHAEPFKIIGYHLPTLTNINIKNMTENNKKLIDLEKSHQILDNDQKEISKQNIKNHILTKSIEKEEKVSRVVTLSLGSISVVLSALICVIGGITGLCKWRKEKKRGLEFEISARAQKKMETNQEI
jgi:hypothetical protein